MSDIEQLWLPVQPLPITLPVYVRPADTPPSSLLVDFDKAKPGDLTGLVAGYSANFERNDALQRHLEVFYVEGPTGAQAQHYADLPNPLRGQAAQVALEHLYLNSCVNDDVLDWDVVANPDIYTAVTFTFAKVRILMDVELLRAPQYVLDEIEDSDPSPIRPCVIEVFGEMVPTVRAMVARDHLRYALKLLPEKMSAIKGAEFHFIHF